MSKLWFSGVLFLLVALGSCASIQCQASQIFKDLHEAIINKEKRAVELAHKIDDKYIDALISVDGDFFGENYWRNWNIDRSFTTTIINLALFSDQIHVVEILIQRGANLSIKDQNGNTALHVASCLGLKTVVIMILKILAPQDINVRNNAGANALHMAVIYKRADVMEELLKNFADPFITDRFENTALHLAIHRSQYFGAELIYMIIDAAMQQTINNLGQNGMTDPCRDRDIVREEMSKFINLQNGTGKTALMNAVTDMNCCVEIVDLLFKNGADPLIVDIHGNTALGVASMWERGENFISPLLTAMRQQIINNLANNVVPGPSVWSPKLVRNGGDRDMIRESMVKFINSRNHCGQSALHLAFEFQDCPVAIVKILLKHDADPRIPDNNGKTALDLAIQNEQPDAIIKIVDAVRNMPKLHFLQNGMTPPLYSGLIKHLADHHLPRDIISVIFTDDIIKLWKRSAENALVWAESTKRDDLVDFLKIICGITETGQPIDASKQLPSVINDC